MTQSNEIAEDLRFVRTAIEARDKPRRTTNAHLIIWTLYSLICIPTYDYLPRYGGRINLVGWLLAAVLSWVFGKRAAIKSGQFDRAMVGRVMLHWFGGVALLLIATVGLAVVNPGLDGLVVSQVSVILVGFLYYTAGVNFPDSRFMRWAGPIIVVAGVAIALVPHYRWTAMGAIFALCLMAPVLFSRRAAGGLQTP